MYAEVKSSNGTILVDTDTLLFEKRTLFVTGEITERSASEFQKCMMVFQMRDTKAPVDIMITSGGGAVTAGLLYIDCITHAPMPVRLYCAGYAYSMAAVIFACGEKGSRTMLPGSELMLHAPWLMNGSGGRAEDLEETAKRIRCTENRICSLLAASTGKAQRTISTMLRQDRYFTPEEAVAYGLCDQIGMMEGWK